MAEFVTIKLDAQEALDLHTIIKALKSTEKKLVDEGGLTEAPGLDDRYFKVLLQLERGLRGIGYIPAAMGWTHLKRGPRS